MTKSPWGMAANKARGKHSHGWCAKVNAENGTHWWVGDKWSLTLVDRAVHQSPSDATKAVPRNSHPAVRAFMVVPVERLPDGTWREVPE